MQRHTDGNTLRIERDELALKGLRPAIISTWGRLFIIFFVKINKDRFLYRRSASQLWSRYYVLLFLLFFQSMSFYWVTNFKDALGSPSTQKYLRGYLREWVSCTKMFSRTSFDFVVRVLRQAFGKSNRNCNFGAVSVFYGLIRVGDLHFRKRASHKWQQE